MTNENKIKKMKWNETSPEKQTEMEIAGVITFDSHGYWEKIIKIEKKDLRWEENCFQVAYKIYQITHGIFLVSIISEVMNM